MSNNMSKNPERLSKNMCMYIKPTIEILITASTVTVAKIFVIFLFITTNIYYICSIRTVSTAHTTCIPAFMLLHFMVWHSLILSLQLQQIPFRCCLGKYDLSESSVLVYHSHLTPILFQWALEPRCLDASIPQLEDVREGNVVLLHFPLAVSGRGRFYPLRLASSKPFQGEYPHSHMWYALGLDKICLAKFE